MKQQQRSFIIYNNNYTNKYKENHNDIFTPLHSDAHKLIKDNQIIRNTLNLKK
jgi:hypothetical protein